METLETQQSVNEIDKNEILKSLLNPSKQMIIEYLSRFKYGSASSFTRMIGIKQPTVSKALKGLMACKMINKEKVGSVTVYQLNKEALIQIITEVLKSQLFSDYKPKT